MVDGAVVEGGETIHVGGGTALGELDAGVVPLGG